VIVGDGLLRRSAWDLGGREEVGSLAGFTPDACCDSRSGTLEIGWYKYPGPHLK